MSVRRALQATITALSVVVLSLGTTPPTMSAKPTPGGTGGGIAVKIQGFDALSKSWTPGNTGGYAEGDSIPFRLVLTGPGTLSTLQVVADHLRGDVKGIEDLNSFQVCTGAPTTTPAGATGCTAPNQTSMTVTRDVPDPVSSGVVQVAYTFRNVVVPSSGLVLRWGAELAIGSHLYAGSALHMAVGNATTSSGAISFGSKDVPIPVNAIIATETDKKIDGRDAISASDPLSVGQRVTVTITSKAVGPAKGTQNLTVTDQLPDCLRYAGNASPAPTAAPTAVGGVVPPGGEVTWTFSAVKNGTTRTVTFDAVVVSVGSCTNVATTSSDKTRFPSRDTVPISTVGAPDVSVVKDCDDVVAPGGLATCTLTYRNDGDAVARDVTLTDVLDPGLTYVAVAGEPQPSGDPLTWTIGDLAAGDGDVITYQVRVPATGPPGAQEFRNTATIHTNGDPDPGDDTDTEVITVTFAVDLALTKRCPGTIPANTPTEESVTYRNTGTAAATGVTIVDTLPVGMSYVTGSASLAPTSVVGRTITWVIGNVPAGSALVTITYRVAVATAGQYTNVATITSDQPDSDTTDNRAECTAGASYTDVAVDKACPSNASPGAVVTHTVSFANLGNQPAAGVQVVDTLGAGLTYRAGSAKVDGSPVSPSVAGQVLTFTLGTVGAGDSGVITYEVQLAATAPSSGVRTFTDTAAISTTSSNSLNQSNDSATCSTAADYQPHLVLTKTGCKDTVVPGGYQTYTLRYLNDGSAPATGTTLTDTPPDDQQVSAAPGANVAGNTATWALGSLAPGEDGTRSLTVQVNAADGTQVSNTATLDADNAAPTTATAFTHVSGAGAETHGSAYGIDVRALNLLLIDKLVASASSAPDGIGDDQAGPTATLTLPGVVNAGILSSASHSGVDIGASTTTSTSTVADLNLLNGLITAKAVRSVSTSTAGPLGASSNNDGSTFTDLVIAGQPVPNSVAPNTVINLPLGIGSVKLRAEKVTAGVDAQGRYVTTATTNMIEVTLTGLLVVPLGTKVVVGHSDSSATYPSGAPCGARPNTVSGKAFTAFVDNLLLDDLYVNRAEIAPLGGTSTANAASVPGLPGILTASALTNSATGSIGTPPTATSTSKAAGVNLLAGLVTADLIDVKATSTADGTTAGTVLTANFVNLRVGGLTINGTVSPNFTIDVPYGGGIAHVVLNEQVVNTPAGGKDTAGTVNAVHVRLFSAVGLLTTDIVVVSAHSDAHTS
ncbi:hypothetical protein CFH99_14935 [Nocardioides aromaticivorans]|uniref:DUF11 domain-containing protein n=1 Tax=Nocardioides aromaticivorans TaxID=200618 RepID=A0ABX7PLR7_9ACTN|nr:choice-of-anchor P family protein [Nocardioides aromaticivorans]QSR26924.1 hypothetical protein CFH99_14935 [Nocardioides aromaticivorans]